MCRVETVLKGGNIHGEVTYGAIELSGMAVEVFIEPGIGLIMQNDVVEEPGFALDVQYSMGDPELGPCYCLLIAEGRSAGKGDNEELTQAFALLLKKSFSSPAAYERIGTALSPNILPWFKDCPQSSILLV